MDLVKGKKGLIMGVANERSIAWGIAKKLSENGAELAFTYLGDALKKRVTPLAESVNSKFLLDCNVENKDDIKKTFEEIKKKWGQIDFVVHAIAFSDRAELSGQYIDTSRENFTKSMLVSCFSFTETAKEASKIMKSGSSMLTLTYESTKVIPNYNVMGVAKAALEASVRYLSEELGPENQVRVNAISAGPIRTLASSAIGGILDMIHNVEEKAPLRRTVTQIEVGNTAAFLLSDLSSGISGQTVYVDAGYCINGM